jgi:predicted permease
VNLAASACVYGFMQTLLADLRFGARLLRRSPVFAATAVASLAVGLAAGTTVFSLADALLFRPRPGIVDAGSLVDVGRTQHGGGFDTVSYPNYADYRDHNTAFSGVAAYGVEPFPLSLDAAGAVDRVYGMVVSDNYFAVLGVTPSRGRFFGPSERDVHEPHAVAVIGQRLWRQRFAADPGVVGRVIRLNNQPVTVIGIAPEGFVGTGILAPDLWVPLSMRPALTGGHADLFDSREAVWLMAFARLRTGVTVGQAQASMTSLAAALERQYPDANRGKGIRLSPSHRLTGQLREPVALFMGVLSVLVALVLLVASANVAGMLLARSAARRRELAVRLAIGAGRGRIARQLLTESLLLFALGGIGGVGLAWGAERLLQALLPALPVPVVLDLRLDARVLAFGLGLSLVTGCAFGLLPAFRASRVDLAPLMKGHADALARRLGGRGAFVAAQVAFALVLLVSASLFLRALQRASTIDPGFRTAGVDVVFLDFRMGGHAGDEATTFGRRLVDRLQAQPGVESVAIAGVVPLGGDGLSFGRVRAPGRPDEGRTGGLEADWNVVTADYFRTLDIPIVRGHAFSPTDGTGGPAVAVVNQALAAALWPGEDPIGRSFEVTGPRGATDRTLQVVGVARDAKYRWLGDEGRPFVYVPFGQQAYERQTLLVRHGGGTSSVPVVRRLLAELDPAMPIIQATTLEAYAGIGLLPQRLAGWVAGSLGLVGLLLAALGIYGVTAYHATRRTRELGIRVALGADTSSVTRLVLWQGFRLAVAGAAIGLLIAAGVSRLFASLLLGVGSLDPAAFAGSAGVFVCVTLAASWIPARRAGRRDPVEALRNEGGI